MHADSRGILACNVRRYRLGLAKQRGAEQAKSLDEATHVVVDECLGWDDIKSILAPHPDLNRLTVVNALYIVECMNWKGELDPDQYHYQVKGYAAAFQAPSDGPPSISLRKNPKDLPLKPAQRDPRKWDSVPAPDTPPGSQASSGPVRAAEKPTSHSEGPSHDASSQEQQQSQEAAPLTGEPYNDELSDCIAVSLQAKDLPLDEDDDADPSGETLNRSDQDSDRESGSEEENAAKRRRIGKASRKVLTFDDRFACNRGGTLDGPKENGPNARAIEVLQKMADHYQQLQDEHFRASSYRKAIKAIQRHPKKLTTFDEAIVIPHVGGRIARKIEEIALTDRLRQLEFVENDPMNEVLKTFMGIYGVGMAQASRWYAQGYRTLEDLRQKAKLSTNQKVGIDHYDDLNTRIPRLEVEALGSFVKAAAEKMTEGLELIIGGSYRRGAQNSGDIDFIVTRKGTTSAEQLLSPLLQLTNYLEAEGFLVARLASSRSEKGSKWHGCCVLPKPRGVDEKDYKPVWRRIDFLTVPESEMGAALIYFTGNDIFNRSIRLLASKRQMRLNQRGLFKKCMRGPGRKKLTDGELVESRDERKIFDILRVRWREPHERWC